MEAGFDEVEDVVVKGLGSVEQEKIDGFGEVDGEGFEGGIAFAEFDKVDQTCGREVLAGSVDFGGFEFAGDESASAVVA